MSEIESVRGTLQLVSGESLEKTCEIECKINGITRATYSGAFIDQISEDLSDKYIILNDQLYKFLKKEDITNISELHTNEDGTIDFIVQFYNGGAGLGEVLEWAMDDQIGNK